MDIVGNNKKIIGLTTFTLFLLTIPATNWTLNHYGFVNLPLLGPVASGVFWVGVSFVLRDLAQTFLGKVWAWTAIVAGTILTSLLVDPFLAFASGMAFLWSESTDALVFTPLADRGKFVVGVAISGVAASVVDSILFLQLAFGSPAGWWQLFVVKSVIVMAATPIAAWGRNAVSRNF